MLDTQDHKIDKTLSRDERLKRLAKNLCLDKEEHAKCSNILTQAIITSGRRKESELKQSLNQFRDPHLSNAYSANIIGNSPDFKQCPYIACKGANANSVGSFFSNLVLNKDLKVEAIVRVGNAGDYSRDDFVDYILSDKEWEEKESSIEEKQSDSSPITKSTFTVTSKLMRGKQKLIRAGTIYTSHTRIGPIKNEVTITRYNNGQEEETKTLPVYDIPIDDGSVFICLEDKAYQTKHPDDGQEYAHNDIPVSLLYEIYKLSDKGHLITHCKAGAGRTNHLFLTCFIVDYWDEIYAQGVDSPEQIAYLIAYIRSHRGGGLHTKQQIIQAEKNAAALKKYEDTLPPEQRKKRPSLSFSDLKKQVDPLAKTVIVDGLTIEEAILIDPTYLKQFDKWIQKIHEDLKSLPSDDEKENKKEDGIILEKPSYSSFKAEVNELIVQFQTKFSGNDHYIKINTPSDQNLMTETIPHLIDTIKKSTSPYFNLTTYLQEIEKNEKQLISNVQASAKVVNTGKRLIIINQIQSDFNTIEKNLSEISKKNTIGDLKSLEIAVRKWLNYSAPIIKEASVQSLKFFKLIADNLAGIIKNIESYENHHSEFDLKRLKNYINQLTIATSNLPSNFNHLSEGLNQVLIDATTYLKAKSPKIAQEKIEPLISLSALSALPDMSSSSAFSSSASSNSSSSVNSSSSSSSVNSSSSSSSLNSSSSESFTPDSFFSSTPESFSSSYSSAIQALESSTALTSSSKINEINANQLPKNEALRYAIETKGDQPLNKEQRLERLSKNLAFDSTTAELAERSNALTEAITISGRRTKSQVEQSYIQFRDPHLLNDVYSINIIGDSFYVACKGPDKTKVGSFFSNVLFNKALKIEGIVRIGTGNNQWKSDFADYILPDTKWQEEKNLTDEKNSDSSPITKPTFTVRSKLIRGKQKLISHGTIYAHHTRIGPIKNEVTITRNGQEEETKTLPVYDIPIKDGSAFICLEDKAYQTRHPDDEQYAHNDIPVSILYEIYKLSDEGHLIIHCQAGVGRTNHLVLTCFIADYSNEIYVEGVASQEQIDYLIAYIRSHRGGGLHNKQQITQAEENATALKKYEETLAPDQRKKPPSLSFSDLKKQVDQLAKTVIVDGLTIEEAILIDPAYLKHFDKWLQEIDENLKDLPIDDEKENKKKGGIVLKKPFYSSFKTGIQNVIKKLQKESFTPHEQYIVIQTINTLISSTKFSITAPYFDLTKNLQGIEEKTEQKSIPSMLAQDLDLVRIVNMGKRLSAINQIQKRFNEIEEDLIDISNEENNKELKPIEISVRSWLNNSATIINKEPLIQLLKIFALIADNLPELIKNIKYHLKFTSLDYLKGVKNRIDELETFIQQFENFIPLEELKEILRYAKAYLQEKDSEIALQPNNSKNNENYPKLKHALEIHFGDEFETTDLITVSNSTPVMSSFSASSSFSSSYLTTSTEEQRELPNRDPLLLTLPSPPVQPETHHSEQETDSEQKIISENPFHDSPQPTIPNIYNNNKHNRHKAFQIEETSIWFENWNTLTPSMKFLYFLFNFIIFAVAVALMATGIGGAVSGAELFIAALSTKLASGIGISFGSLAVMGSIWSYQKSLGFVKVAAGVCFIAGLMLLFTGVGGIFTPILLLTSHSLWMEFAIGIGLPALYFNFRFAMNTFFKDICNCLSQISFTNVPDLPATAGYGAQNVPVPHFIQDHYANTGADNPGYVDNVVPATTNVIDVDVMGMTSETPSKTV